MDRQRDLPRPPWAYHAMGAPNHTNDVVPPALGLFHTGSKGLPGNDDLGALSAWYVWAGISLYPETPGRAELALSTPSSDSVTVHRSNGRTLRVDASGATSGRHYIDGVRVNGAPHPADWLGAAALDGDLSIDLRLTADRGTRWGTGATDTYPSFAEGRRPALGTADRATAHPGDSTSSTLTLHPVGRDGTRARWSIDAPDGVRVQPSSGTIGAHPVRLRIEVGKETEPGPLSLPVTLRTVHGQPLPRADVHLAVTRPGTTSVLPRADEAGVSPEDRPLSDLNGYGGSYVAKALAADGLAPGRQVTVDGIRHRWPDAAPGSPDNVNAHGQTLPVHGASGTRRLGFLGAGNEGPTEGTVTVHYADGTAQRSHVALADWHLDNDSEPPAGNTAAATMPVRQMPSGTPEKLTTYVWATAVRVDPGRRITSVTLPRDTTGGQMHVFAVGQG